MRRRRPFTCARISIEADRVRGGVTAPSVAKGKMP
jgi:hypothetical protein